MANRHASWLFLAILTAAVVTNADAQMRGPTILDVDYANTAVYNGKGQVVLPATEEYGPFDYGNYSRYQTIKGQYETNMGGLERIRSTFPPGARVDRFIRNGRQTWRDYDRDRSSGGSVKIQGWINQSGNFLSGAGAMPQLTLRVDGIFNTGKGPIYTGQVNPGQVYTGQSGPFQLPNYGFYNEYGPLYQGTTTKVPLGWNTGQNVLTGSVNQSPWAPQSSTTQVANVQGMSYLNWFQTFVLPYLRGNTGLSLNGTTGVANQPTSTTGNPAAATTTTASAGTDQSVYNLAVQQNQNWQNLLTTQQQATQALQTKQQQELTQAQTALTQLQQQLAATTNADQKKLIQAQIDEKQKALQTLQTTQADEKKKLADAQTAERAKLKQQMTDDVAAQLKTANESIDTKKKELEAITKEETDNKTKSTELTTQISTKTKELEALRTQYQTDVAKLQSDYQTLANQTQQAINLLQQQYASTTDATQRTNIQNQINQKSQEIQTAATNCQTQMKQKYDDAVKAQNDKTAEITKLNSDLSALQTAATTIAQRKQQANQAVADLQTKIQSLQQRQTQVSQAQ